MAEAGTTRDGMAAALGIAAATLRKHYADVLADHPPVQNPPPEGGRFRPGQSGNPTGMSKDAAEFRKTCRELAALGLDEVHRRLLDPDTPAAAFVALWKELRDTGYGKPKESIEHSGPDGGPIPTLAIVTDDPVEAAKVYQRLMDAG